MTEGFSPPERSAHESAAAWKSTEALKLLNGDFELLRELCQIFLTESPKLMQKLQQALLEKDADALMRAAHRLKDEVSYLGAPRAMLAAAQLEEIGHGKDLSRAREVLTVLQNETSTLQLGLQQLLMGLIP
jgi:HPt (histidine-containing phosphotransfer) domain-containing protein